MTVAENIMLGAFPTKGGWTKTKEMKKIAADTLKEIGVEVDLDEPHLKAFSSTSSVC